jgi:hypothetical protein
MARKRTRRYVRDLVDNIRESEHPVHRTFLLTCKNRALALGTLRGCCGHPGQPGC